VTTPHPLVEYAGLIEAAGQRARARDTPVVTCIMDGALDADAKRALRQHGVANYPDPTRAAGAIDALCRYATVRDRPPVDPPAPSDVIALDTARSIVERARDEGRSRLGVDSLDLLTACGIDVPEWDIAEGPADAARLAADIGGPVVLKVVSPSIAHKVDVGGVRLGVPPAEVEAACREMLDDVAASAPEAAVDGVLVQAAVDTDDAVEVVVGATGSRFGPLVTFGLGGVFVEHLDDAAFALAPLDRLRARELIESIDASDRFEGARGQSGVDTEALVDTLVRLSVLVDAVPAIADLDVNPLLAGPGGVTAVDLYAELD
jgi:acetyltransferase